MLLSRGERTICLDELRNVWRKDLKEGEGGKGMKGLAYLLTTERQQWNNRDTRRKWKGKYDMEVRARDYCGMSPSPLLLHHEWHIQARVATDH